MGSSTRKKPYFPHSATCLAWFTRDAIIWHLYKWLKAKRYVNPDIRGWTSIQKKCSNLKKLIYFLFNFWRTLCNLEMLNEKVRFWIWWEVKHTLFLLCKQVKRHRRTIFSWIWKYIVVLFYLNHWKLWILYVMPFNYWIMLLAFFVWHFISYKFLQMKSLFLLSRYTKKRSCLVINYSLCSQIWHFLCCISYFLNYVKVCTGWAVCT